MSEATCRTCPFWLAGDPLGHCRAAPPIPLADAPETEAGFWCGEHPLRQRDRFAAMAMQGILAATRRGDIAPALAAADAYAVADAMLAESGREPSRG